MNYIHAMRQKIGHSPLILAGAAVLILAKFAASVQNL